VETVLVQKLKRPEGSGLWGAYVLGDDDHGHWLYSPVGCLYRGEAGGVVGYCHVGAMDLHRPGLPTIHLIPHNRWWIATWAIDDEQERRRISVDICTPPVLVDRTWSYVDLELDPLSDAPGQVETEDEDEFVQACAAGLISSVEQLEARNATAEVEATIRAQDEPFGQLGWHKLDQAMAMSLEPLADLPDE
jgi:predicted RNA-binding protein associated with RNAse of E/G family